MSYFYSIKAKLKWVWFVFKPYLCSKESAFHSDLVGTNNNNPYSNRMDEMWVLQREELNIHHLTIWRKKKKKLWSSMTHVNHRYSFIEFITIQELPPIREVKTIVWELDK